MLVLREFGSHGGLTESRTYTERQLISFEPLLPSLRQKYWKTNLEQAFRSTLLAAYEFELQFFIFLSTTYFRYQQAAQCISLSVKSIRLSRLKVSSGCSSKAPILDETLITRPFSLKKGNICFVKRITPSRLVDITFLAVSISGIQFWASWPVTPALLTSKSKSIFSQRMLLMNWSMLQLLHISSCLVLTRLLVSILFHLC